MLPGIGIAAGLISAGNPLIMVGSQTTTWSSADSAATLTLPTGIQSGDLLVASMNVTDFNTPSAETWTGDTGWTERIDQNARPNLRVATKTAGGSEVDPVFTTTADFGFGNMTGTIYAFRNASFDTIGAIVTSGVNGTISYGSITSAGGYVLAIIASGEEAAVPTYGTPSGFAAAGQANITRAYHKTFYKDVSAGVVSGLSSTISGQTSGSFNAGVLIGIKPA